MANLYRKKHFCEKKNLYLVKKMTFSEIKILEMAVNDRSESTADLSFDN